MQCTGDTTYSMSQLCLEAWSNSENQSEFWIDQNCFPQNIDSVRVIAGIWCTINALIGLPGNLLTLLAIPYCVRRKKFNLHHNWSNTVFILNLAFADCLYCAINLPIYSIQYINTSWDWGLLSCKITANIRYFNAFADWMSVALVAASRCITVTKPKLLYKIFSVKKYRILILCSVWIYGIILLIPTNLGVLGEFGFNCHFGKCDFIPNSDYYHGIRPAGLLYGTAFLGPGIIICISYGYIGYYVWNNHRYLKKYGASSTKKVLSQKEARTTWTLALVCFCYFLFVMPITIVNILHDFGVHGILDSYCYLFAFCVYWLQYSLNFFIYAARSEQYRRAYLFFLKEVKYSICGRPDVMSKTTTTAVFYIDRNKISSILEHRSRPLNMDEATAIFESIQQTCSNQSNNSSAAVIVICREERKYQRCSGVHSDYYFNDWKFNPISEFFKDALPLHKSVLSFNQQNMRRRSSIH